MIEDYIDFHILFITMSLTLFLHYITSPKKDIVFKKKYNN